MDLEKSYDAVFVSLQCQQGIMSSENVSFRKEIITSYFLRNVTFLAKNISVESVNTRARSTANTKYELYF